VPSRKRNSRRSTGKDTEAKLEEDPVLGRNRKRKQPDPDDLAADVAVSNTKPAESVEKAEREKRGRGKKKKVERGGVAGIESEERKLPFQAPTKSSSISSGAITSPSVSATSAAAVTKPTSSPLKIILPRLSSIMAAKRPAQSSSQPSSSGAGPPRCAGRQRNGASGLPADITAGSPGPSSASSTHLSANW
jgi:hypothetical protein